MPGSYYQGSWDQGTEILFLAPDKEGKEGGMISRVAEVRPYEFVSLEHQGMIEKGVRDTESDKVKPWKGIHENYTFIARDGGTELSIDMDIQESEKEFMETAW